MQHILGCIGVGRRLVDPNDPEAGSCERFRHGTQWPVEEGEVHADASEVIVLGLLGDPEILQIGVHDRQRARVVDRDRQPAPGVSTRWNSVNGARPVLQGVQDQPRHYDVEGCVLPGQRARPDRGPAGPCRESFCGDRGRKTEELFGGANGTADAAVGGTGHGGAVPSSGPGSRGCRSRREAKPPGAASAFSSPPCRSSFRRRGLPLGRPLRPGRGAPARIPALSWSERSRRRSSGVFPPHMPCGGPSRSAATRQSFWTAQERQTRGAYSKEPDRCRAPRPGRTGPDPPRQEAAASHADEASRLTLELNPRCPSSATPAS